MVSDFDSFKTSYTRTWIYIIFQNCFTLEDEVITIFRNVGKHSECQIPEDLNLHLYRCEKLKFRVILYTEYKKIYFTRVYTEGIFIHTVLLSKELEYFSLKTTDFSQQ